MPVRTSNAQILSLPNRSVRKLPLRPMTLSERQLHLQVADTHDSYEFHDVIPVIQHIDDPYPFVFHEGNVVFFKSDNGSWNRGRIILQPRMGSLSIGPEIGIYYLVEYHVKERPVRKYVAPMNGEVKPDTVQTRHLLISGGFKTIKDFWSIQ